MTFLDRGDLSILCPLMEGKGGGGAVKFKKQMQFTKLQMTYLLDYVREFCLTVFCTPLLHS